MAHRAAATASSSKETTNFARLCRLLVDVGTQVLRDTLDGIHAPGTLHAGLARNRTALQSLRTRRIISATQWGKLFPAVLTSMLTAHFDTTLLMVLLRNICDLPSPATGWDTLPAVTRTWLVKRIPVVLIILETLCTRFSRWRNGVKQGNSSWVKTRENPHHRDAQKVAAAAQ